MRRAVEFEFFAVFVFVNGVIRAYTESVGKERESKVVFAVFRTEVVRGNVVFAEPERVDGMPRFHGNRAVFGGDVMRIERAFVTVRTVAVNEQDFAVRILLVGKRESLRVVFYIAVVNRLYRGESYRFAKRVIVKVISRAVNRLAGRNDEFERDGRVVGNERIDDYFKRG